MNSLTSFQSYINDLNKAQNQSLSFPIRSITASVEVRCPLCDGIITIDETRVGKCVVCEKELTLKQISTYWRERNLQDIEAEKLQRRFGRDMRSGGIKEKVHGR